MGSVVTPISSERGSEIFGYFSSSETAESEVVACVEALDLPMRLVAPGLDPALRARFEAAGHVIEDRPIAASDIAARSRMMLTAGQHGTTCMGMAMGLPMVAMPQHQEQQSNARGAEKVGSSLTVLREERTAEALRAAIHECYHSAAMSDAAMGYGVSLPRNSRAEMTQAIRARFEGI